MSGSDEPLTLEAHKTMLNVLREIQGQMRELRATLTKLENIGLLAPIEARPMQLQATLAADAAKTERDQRRIRSLIEALKVERSAAPFEMITNTLEDGWGQAVELWPSPAVVQADAADQIINRAILVGALLDGLMEAINQVAH